MASLQRFFCNFAQASALHIFRAGVFMGVCFHVAIARPSFEFEQYMFPSLALAVILQISGILSVVIFSHQTIPGIMVQTIVLWIGFGFGCLFSTSIHRLFLHRCRAFPGPLAAKLTRFYAAHLNAKDVQFYKELGKLHENYGDYLRMGMFDV